jgi:hypothetical protein
MELFCILRFLLPVRESQRAELALALPATSDPPLVVAAVAVLVAGLDEALVAGSPARLSSLEAEKSGTEGGGQSTNK